MSLQPNETFDFAKGLALLNSSPVERKELTARLAQLPPAQRATCPKCGATTVQVVNVEKKNLGAALAAEWLLDSTAAGVTAGSRNVTCNACVACGFQWLPGSPHEALTRLVSGQLGEDTRERLFAQLKRRGRELEDEKGKSQRRAAIFLALVGMVVGGFWAYSNYFSPEARARIQDLKRTDVWVQCVLQESAQSGDCGPPVSRASLNAWFEDGHMDVLANGPSRVKLESKTVK